MILVPLFDLKFLTEFAAGGVGISKSAAPASAAKFSVGCGAKLVDRPKLRDRHCDVIRQGW